jgi:hypothetical protein
MRTLGLFFLIFTALLPAASGSDLMTKIAHYSCASDPAIKALKELKESENESTANYEALAGTALQLLIEDRANLVEYQKLYRREFGTGLESPIGNSLDSWMTTQISEINSNIAAIATHMKVIHEKALESSDGADELTVRDWGVRTRINDKNLILKKQRDAATVNLRFYRRLATVLKLSLGAYIASSLFILPHYTADLGLILLPGVGLAVGAWKAARAAKRAQGSIEAAKPFEMPVHLRKKILTTEKNQNVAASFWQALRQNASLDAEGISTRSLKEKTEWLEVIRSSAEAQIHRAMTYTAACANILLH